MRKSQFLPPRLNHRPKRSKGLPQDFCTVKAEETAMASSNWVPVILLFIISYISAEVVRNEGRGEEGKGSANQLGGRALMGFKETPSGGNVTYECSPSGPCVPCAYSEKNDEKYRCSETGYRIPLKCVKIGSVSKEVNGKKAQKGRSTRERIHSEVDLLVNSYAAEKLPSSITRRHLRDESSGSEDGKLAYVTYRSCIPAVNEERFSVIGFEGLMFGLLLLSGSAMYYRRKRVNVVPAGAVRVPNSRF